MPMRIKACISLTVLAAVLTAASQAQVPATAGHQRKPPAMVEPVFLFPETAGVSDYRPVLNADATAVVFERTIAGATELYAATLPGAARRRRSPTFPGQHAPTGAGSGQAEN